jgi:hypothetical protein
VRTRFLELNRAEAPTIMRSCGCRLCLVYAKVERKRTKDLLRGAKNFSQNFGGLGRRPRQLLPGSGLPWKSPTRAARRQQFLAKIKSLIFNPVEWLDQAEQSTLIKARKIATSFASAGAGGEAVSSSFAIPYASSSWGQSLAWPPTKAMHFV